jgi:hypothetical protein
LGSRFGRTTRWRTCSSRGKQNVRMETNAGYAVERIPAARRIT